MGGEASPACQGKESTSVGYALPRKAAFKALIRSSSTKQTLKSRRPRSSALRRRSAKSRAAPRPTFDRFSRLRIIADSAESRGAGTGYRAEVYSAGGSPPLEAVPEAGSPCGFGLA